MRNIVRISVSGGVICWNGHVLMAWSKTQAVIALGSAESELYGMVKASSETLGIMALLGEWGYKVNAEVKGDASAALGIIARKGLGKVRHIDVSHLWLQQVSATERIRYGKVA